MDDASKAIPRQAKFIGSVIVYIPLPTCTLRDRMLVKVLCLGKSSFYRSLYRIKDKGRLFCLHTAIVYTELLNSQPPSAIA
ncbi:MAG: hypothetical protein V7K53_31450 [Nostoc sp.]|uniref:hypothetical protein n=1 Tax=Nostoc sp. TaxID=1180 RepID=UPI002FF68E73